MKEEIIIRKANREDLKSVKSIFDLFVLESFAAYAVDTISIETMEERFDQAKIFLVLQNQDEIIGFGRISPYKSFNNFSHTGILTYFILPEYTGIGLGSRLFDELIKSGKELGIWNYLAHISSKNEQSINFHKKHGFIEVGRFKDVAFKFGESLDVIWVQKQYPKEEIHL